MSDPIQGNAPEAVDPAAFALPRYNKQFRKNRNRVIRNAMAEEMERWADVGIFIPENPTVRKFLAHRLLWMTMKLLHDPLAPVEMHNVYPTMRHVRQALDGVETINGGINA